MGKEQKLTSADIIRDTDHYCARNYAPKKVVIERAAGSKVWDPEGNWYYDMLSAYSANNLGHCHPEVVTAAKEQMGRVTLTSRAFYSANLGEFCKKLAAMTGKDMVLPMNTGAEAVETALKTARLWGSKVKGVENSRQQIIVCEGNFHGRTISIISFSTDPIARGGYGPYTPGFTVIPYGDAAALEAAVTPDTVAFLVEPIQGEAGIILPPKGYLKQVRDICTRHGILFMADEIQTGFARTGAMFACQLEDVQPDVYMLGKALGGGILPVSAVAANKEILGVFTPGSHGSTFGGNPLACAVSIETMQILERDDYPRMARQKGAYFMDRLRAIANDDILEVRGKGLLVGVEFKMPAAGYVAKLIENGILAKETHEHTIRFAPPLNIGIDELEDACVRIGQALTK